MKSFSDYLKERKRVRDVPREGGIGSSYESIIGRKSIPLEKKVKKMPVLLEKKERFPFIHKESSYSPRKFSSPSLSSSKEFNSLPCIKNSKVKHKPHQLKVIKAMTKKRGLIVMHGTGSGKGLTAITSLKCAMDANPKLKAIIITPTSLVENMKKEMRLYGMDPEDYQQGGPTLEGKGRTDSGGEGDRIEFFTITKFVKLFHDNPEYCKDKFIIIDEAHNLKTEIKENLKKKTGLTSNVFIQACKFAYKVMLLTATPVMNRPSEMINLIAMVDGREPMSKQEFNSEVFNDKTGEIPDEKAFKKFFEGKISIYNVGGTDSDSGGEREEKREGYQQVPRERGIARPVGYPTSHTSDIEFEMDKNYYKQYHDIQMGESKKYKHLFSGTKDLTVFYNGVRRASNNIREENNPKIEWIVNKIKEGDKTLVYSSFINAGMGLIAKRLDELGRDEMGRDEVGRGGKKIPYVHISGKLGRSRRKKVVDAFNSGEVKVLLISKAGGEGLDLKGVKNIIITEPPWNESTTRQIIGRGIRYGSHDEIKDEKDRHVEIYKLYMKKPPVKKRIPGDDVEAIDIYLKGFGDGKQDNIQVFLDKLEKYSIEKVV